MPHYNTADGHQAPPAPEASVSRSSDGWVDTGTDTKAEAIAYQRRIDRLAAEIADPTIGPVRRHAAQAEKTNLERALPLQLRAWAEIDARRAKNGGR